MADPENIRTVDPAQNEKAWFVLKRQHCFVSEQVVTKVNFPSFNPEKEEVIDIIFSYIKYPG